MTHAKQNAVWGRPRVWGSNQARTHAIRRGSGYGTFNASHIDQIRQNSRREPHSITVGARIYFIYRTATLA